MSNKVVRFKKELEKSKSRKQRGESRQRKKTDMKVDQYCKDNPLNLPDGVQVYKVFMDKGVPMSENMRRIFSDGLPQKGLTSLKSITYGHVLQPPSGLNRSENFSNKADSEIFRLKDEICDMITDPFWEKIERQQKMGAYTWDGYASLIPNINQQYLTHGCNDVSDYVVKGIEAAVNELPDGIEPISLEEAIGYCRTDTNSGFPLFTSRPFISINEDGESFTILNEEVFRTYEAIAKIVWNGKAHHGMPAVLFKRIQPGEGENSKKRIVECVSRGILWAEARIWRPILEAMRELPPYYGYMHHSNGLGDVIREALEREHVSSLDYSAFDSLIGKFLPILFRALRNKIPSAAPLFEWCSTYYRECPLITPHGWIQGQHGLFSGMFGTSFGGSLINRGLVLGLEMALRDMNVGSFSDVVHLAFGDDTVLSWNGSVQMDLVLQLLRSFGMNLNSDKQEYCGPAECEKFIMFQACYWRWHPGCDDHCVPVYPLVRMATRMAFMEYPDINTKLVYGAGKRISEVECPEVVGPIIAAFISKLSESSNHPDIEVFIRRYQWTWIHHLNPLECVSDDRVLMFVNRYLGYVDASGEDFLSQRVCEILLLNIERIDQELTPKRVVYTGDELRALIIQRKTGSNRVVANDVGHDSTSDDLFEAIRNSGLSEGLQNSILLRLPEEALV